MANIPFSNLPAVPGLSGAEIVPLVQGGVDKRTTTAAIAALAAAGVIPSASVRIITVAGTIDVADTDAAIIFNLAAPGSVTLNLPVSTYRGGLPLQISDFGGNAGDIMTLPAGTQTIMGLGFAVFSSTGQGAGSAAAVTLYPNVALDGWYIA